MHTSKPEERPELTHVEEGLSLIPHGCVVQHKSCYQPSSRVRIPVVDESIATSRFIQYSRFRECADFINDIGNMVNDAGLNLERLSNDPKYYFLKHDFVPSGIKCLRSGPKSNDVDPPFSSGWLRP